MKLYNSYLELCKVTKISEPKNYSSHVVLNRNSDIYKTLQMFNKTDTVTFPLLRMLAKVSCTPKHYNEILRLENQAKNDHLKGVLF